MNRAEYYASLLRCSLDRPDIHHIEKPDGDIANVFRNLKVPELYRDYHDAEHLASMGERIALTVMRPLEIVVVDNMRIVNVLGMAVFECRLDRTYGVYLWQPNDHGYGWRLVETDGEGMPLIDFPRTTLWADKFEWLFRCESVRRIGNEMAANEWFDFVWNYGLKNAVTTAPVERLRLLIGDALQPRTATVRELQKRQALGMIAHIDVIHYNLLRFAELWIRHSHRAERAALRVPFDINQPKENLH
jgi:hypothetical protein